jgi:pyruvate dehydrogenase (quinone)
MRRICGYLVTGINGVLGAWQRAGSIEFFQVRHEEMASLMAVALAKSPAKSEFVCPPVVRERPT